jgi:hypothetical protein
VFTSLGDINQHPLAETSAGFLFSAIFLEQQKQIHPNRMNCRARRKGGFALNAWHVA